MTADPTTRWAGLRRGCATVALAVAILCGGGAHASADDAATVPGGERWNPPIVPFSLHRPYEAPAHEYGPGHRGIDLRTAGPTTVVAPAPGIVAFSGDVAGRGILTIDHGGGLVSTLEPVDSDLSPGSAVARGEPVATISVGGHADPGALHLGVRLDGEYINPMLLLGGVPRAVLLPCC